MAHRGGASYGPDNSLQAIESSINCQADIIEVDVWKTSDHFLICNHGTLMDNIFHGASFNRPWEEIKVKKPYIPTLTEVVEYIDSRVPLTLHIKDKKIEPEDVLKDIKNHDNHLVVLSDNDWSWLLELKKADSRVITAKTCLGTCANFKRCLDFKVDCLDLIPFTFSREYTEKLKAEEKYFAPAGLTENIQIIKKYVAWGACWVSTVEPGKMRKILQDATMV